MDNHQIPEWLKLRNQIEDLPRDGKLVIYETGGAACESPIFYKNESGEGYYFSSYGAMPPNYKEFKELGGFGMCGSYGKTEDISAIARAISQMNNRKRVGLCTRYVIDKLIESKYDVELVNGGFR